MAGRLGGGQPAYMPSPDWSRNLIDYEDALSHAVSIFTDGTGATPNAERQPGTLNGPVQLGKTSRRRCGNTSTKYETESLLLKTFPHLARGESNVLQKSSTSGLQRVVAGRRPTPEKLWLHSRMAE